jgi:hypothetical protein
LGNSGIYKGEFRHCTKGGVQEYIKGISGSVPRGEFRNIYSGVQALYQGGSSGPYKIKGEFRHCTKGGSQEHIKGSSGTVPRG